MNVGIVAIQLTQNTDLIPTHSTKWTQYIWKQFLKHFLSENVKFSEIFLKRLVISSIIKILKIISLMALQLQTLFNILSLVLII